MHQFDPDGDGRRGGTDGVIAFVIETASLCHGMVPICDVFANSKNDSLKRETSVVIVDAFDLLCISRG